MKCIVTTLSQDPGRKNRYVSNRFCIDSFGFPGFQEVQNHKPSRNEAICPASISRGWSAQVACVVTCSYIKYSLSTDRDIAIVPWSSARGWLIDGFMNAPKTPSKRLMIMTIVNQHHQVNHLSPNHFGIFRYTCLYTRPYLYIYSTLQCPFKSLRLHPKQVIWMYKEVILSANMIYFQCPGHFSHGCRAWENLHLRLAMMRILGSRHRDLHGAVDAEEGLERLGTNGGFMRVYMVFMIL